MPDWIGGNAALNIRNSRSVSVGFIGLGSRHAVNIGNGELGDANYTANELSAWRASLSAGSNMGAYYQSETLVNEVSLSNTQAYEEAHGAGVVLNIRYQNNDSKSITVEIPAPRALLFNGDMTTPVTPNIAAASGTGARILAEIIRDTQNLLNNSSLPPNSYAFVGASKGRRKMASTPGTTIAQVEP